MIVTDRHENHAEEWRDEENRRRLGIPEDGPKLFEDEEENRFDRMEDDE